METFFFRRLVILVFFFQTLSACAGDKYVSNSNILKQLKDLSDIRNPPKSYDLAQEPLTQALVKAVIPEYLRDYIASNKTYSFGTKASKTCLDHLSLLDQQIRKILEDPSYILDEKYAWVVQMVDSWAKIPEGILSGHLNPMGDWDECVNIRSHSSIEEAFQGKYCFTYLFPQDFSAAFRKGKKINAQQSKSWKAVSPVEFLDEVANPLIFPLIPSLVTCMPSSCSTEDFQEILESWFATAGIISPAVSYCGTDEKPNLNAIGIFMTVLVSIIAILIISATVSDSLLENRKELSHYKTKLGIKLLLAFSLVTNIQKWANTSSAEGGFGCIHGIRVLSTCWVVLCHTLTASLVQVPFWNIIEINHFHKSHWSVYFILNGSFSVDTFFTMSGLLAAFSIMKVLEKSKGRLNPLPLYLHRFLRLTPTYAILLGIFMAFYEHLGSGALFNRYAEMDVMNCRRYWWHNLLYINNFVWYEAAEGEEMCQLETWYLAYDMQFFILAPLFMILIYRWKRIGLGVLGIITLASVLVPGIYSGKYELPPTNIPWKLKKENNDFTLKLTNRIAPYLVGLWMGYFLFRLGKRPVKLPKFVVLAGWLVSTGTALAILLGVIPYFDPKNEDNVVAAAFYSGLSRFCWGIVICWIIFACSKGYGGWINSFLSWKAFIPLGRLTFCVYLASLSLQVLLHSSFGQNMVFDMYYTVNLFFSHVIMSFLVGFIFTMAFESPFIALEKILFSTEKIVVQKDNSATLDAYLQNDDKDKNDV